MSSGCQRNAERKHRGVIFDTRTEAVEHLVALRGHVDLDLLGRRIVVELGQDGRARLARLGDLVGPRLVAVVAGLDATTVNPGAIYGPSRTASNSSNVVRTLVVRRPPFVPGGGINVVPLDTVVDGIVAAAERGRTGRRYILGGENLTLVDLAERVGRAAGITLQPGTLPRFAGPLARTLMELVEPFVPDRVWFTPDMAAMFGRYMWFDTSRAAHELGVVASSLDLCLEQTVAQLRRDRRIPAGVGRTRPS